MKTTLFEKFLEYCEEDNEKLAKDIRTWLCDFFDLPNRAIPLSSEEAKWINLNLSKENQTKILGLKTKDGNRKTDIKKN